MVNIIQLVLIFLPFYIYIYAVYAGNLSHGSVQGSHVTYVMLGLTPAVKTPGAISGPDTYHACLVRHLS